jgi:hypothetical protein
LGWGGYGLGHGSTVTKVRRVRQKA